MRTANRHWVNHGSMLITYEARLLEHGALQFYECGRSLLLGSSRTTMTACCMPACTGAFVLRSTEELRLPPLSLMKLATSKIGNSSSLAAAVSIQLVFQLLGLQRAVLAAGFACSGFCSQRAVLAAAVSCSEP